MSNEGNLVQLILKEKQTEVGAYCDNATLIAMPETLREKMSGIRLDGLLPEPNEPLNSGCINTETTPEKEIWSKRMVLKTDSAEDLEFTFPNKDTILNTPATQIPELIVLKAKLNQVKSQLDPYPVGTSQSHTNKMSTSSQVLQNEQKSSNSAFCNQNGGEMFEILCTFDIVPKEVVPQADQLPDIDQTGKNPFDSIHVGDVSGSVISDLRQYLNVNHPTIDWNWMATALNPHHEGNDVGEKMHDDHLILKYPDHWTFLADYTGNILSYSNLKHIANERQWKLLGPRTIKTGTEQDTLRLITATGNTAQSNSPTQEKRVAHREFGEIVTGLMLLHKGGAFILKISSLLETSTVCHLYLLACVFKEVYLFKPACSKEDSSEVYAVCLGYLGKDPIKQVLHKTLVRVIGSYGKIMEEGQSLLPVSSIPQVFLERVQDAAKLFCESQMRIKLSKSSCVSKIKPLSAIDHLLNENKMITTSHVYKCVENGSNNIKQGNGHPLEKLGYIKDNLIAYEVWATPKSQILCQGKFQFPIKSFKFERPYRNIRSSLFYSGRLLSDRKELREISKNYGNEKKMSGLCKGHCLKLVYKFMAMLHDVYVRELKIMCFLDEPWDFINKTDFEIQRNDLQRLVECMKSLEKGHSLFLCRFPLLTRLQTGIIFVLTAVFEKVILYADPDTNVIGIMLHGFKGFKQPENKHMLYSLDDIIGTLEKDEYDRSVLEIVPMKTLLDFYPLEFVVNYNTYLMRLVLLCTVNEIEGRMNGNSEEEGESYKLYIDQPPKSMYYQMICKK